MADRAHHEGCEIGLGTRPSLSPHMKLRRDSVRDRWVVLAPERILTPNAEAADVLLLCNGDRTVADIADALAPEYDSEAHIIAADIIALLQELAASGVIKHE